MKNIFTSFWSMPTWPSAEKCKLGDRVCEAMAHWTTSQLAKLKQSSWSQFECLQERVTNLGAANLSATIRLEDTIDRLNDAIDDLQAQVEVQSAHAQDHNARLLKLESVPSKITVKPGDPVLGHDVFKSTVAKGRRHGPRDRRVVQAYPRVSRAQCRRRKELASGRRDYDKQMRGEEYDGC